MRFSFDLHLSFGKDDDDEQHDADHTGYLTTTETPVGFGREVEE